MLLEAFRSHKRWLMFIAMVLIIPSFVVTGVYSYNRMIHDDGAIARVDGESILPQHFDEAKRKQLDSLRARLGDQFRANMLDSQNARVVLLENLMSDRSLAGETVKENVVVSDAMAIEIIKTFPAFQEDGAFSAERYQNYLASIGYSDEYFVYRVRGDISRQFLSAGVIRSALVPKTVLERLQNLLTEKRTVALSVTGAGKFIDQVSVTEDEARKYWNENQKEFEKPDEITAEYVVFTPDLFLGAKPGEEDIRTFYEQNRNRFGEAEQRRASHILIDAGKGDEEARKAADDVLARVKAKPEDFAALAREYSADPGSSSGGGELGWFGRGLMVPAFEEAVFGAGKGDIVGPVRTEFGYHIIRVDDIQPARVKPLEEVRADIVSLYEEQESQKRFAEEAENFSSMVYEESGTLDPVVEKYGLKVVTVGGIVEEGRVEDPLDSNELEKMLNGESFEHRPSRMLNQHVVESLFSDECLKEKRNTQAVEVSPNTLVAARVAAHVPQHIEPFETARDGIIESLKQKKALDMAAAEGETVLARLRAGEEKAAEFGEPLEISRSHPGMQSPELVTAVMRLPADSVPAYIGVREAEDYVIVHVTKVVPEENSEEATGNLKNEVAGLLGQADDQAYLAALRVKHGAEVISKDYLPGAEPAQP